MTLDIKISDILEKNIPGDKFVTRTQWAKSDQNQEVQEITQYLVNELFKNKTPEAGAIYFEKLPNGTYQIGSFQSSDRKHLFSKN